MKVRCVKAFGSHKPGDVTEIPDGSEASDLHYAPVADEAALAKPVSAAAAADTPKAGA